MKIINAQDTYTKGENEVAIFLAGTCGSKKWRNEVIKFLEKIEEDKVLSLENLVLINPVLKEWPTEDEALQKQIAWESEMIDQCDAFSCYLDSSETDSAMSLFEIGRVLYQFKGKFANSKLNYRIIVSAHPDYRLLKNIDFEMQAVTKSWKTPITPMTVEKNVSMHASKILEAYIKLSK